MAKLVWKIVIIGDPAVGKTSIRRKYLGQTTQKEYIYTIGADFATKKIRLSNNLEVQYQIFDLAGQQKFDNVRASFYSGAKAGILVYDITNQESLKNLPKWVEEVLKNNEGGLETFVIVGNKIDLIDQKEIKDENVLEFTEQLSDKMKHGILHIFTSALTGENINLLFEKVTEKLLRRASEKSEEIAKLAREVMEGKEHITEAMADPSKWKKPIEKPATKIEEFVPRTEKPIEKRVELLENEIFQLTKEIREIQGELAVTKNLLLKYLRRQKNLLDELNS
ncbi:MAG: GTP-binding protein [Candidatus Heimdallarchaeota archaeon]|nr:GTP-binding protein [Candidatus Heimdallarchaeota archaeon]